MRQIESGSQFSSDRVYKVYRAYLRRDNGITGTIKGGELLNELNGCHHFERDLINSVTTRIRSHRSPEIAKMRLP
jgi:hypothetical protein